MNRWTQQKGVPKGYEIIGAISGWDIVASALFRVTVDQASTFPTGDSFEVGDTGVGRSGTDGTLSQPGAAVRFSSPTAVFLKSDCNRILKIQDATVGANNKLYTIETFVDVNTVQMRAADTVTLPEASNGSLTWSIVRVFTDEAPLLPNFDEIDEDFMEQIIDGNEPQTTDFFGVDKYCWEPDFFADVLVSLDSVTTLSPGVFEVTVSDGPTQGPSSIVGTADVIQSVGNWKLIDLGGTAFVIETDPVPSGPDFTFQVIASVAPDVGAAILRYDCPLNTTGDYCAASQVLLRITLGSLALETGTAVERALDRLLTRLDQVTPIHVQIVPIVITTFEASLSLSATVTTP